MNVLRRIAMAIGGTVVIALVIGLAAPKTVHALVSTLVTVVNTPANPVPTQSVDNPALQPFQVTSSCSDSNGQQCSTSGFFMVPAGMTAVVQDVSGNCHLTNFGTAPPLLPGGLLLTSASGSGVFANGAVELTPMFENASNTVTVNFNGGLATETSDVYTFGRQATLYAASVQNIQGSLSFSAAPGSFFSSCTVNVSGYYVKNGLGSSPE